jgi:hypothetical protein
MNRSSLRAAWVCAALAAGLLALHFNAGRLPAWTGRLSVFAGAIALGGVAFAAHAMGRRGWTSLLCWRAQLAFAANGLLGLALLAYPR